MHSAVDAVVVDVPAGHLLSHDDAPAPLIKPAAQGVHAEPLDGLYVPALHWTQDVDLVLVVVVPAGQAAHDVDPRLAAYVYNAQVVQADAPTEEYVPAPQGMHASANTWPSYALYVPPVQQQQLYSAIGETVALTLQCCYWTRCVSLPPIPRPVFIINIFWGKRKKKTTLIKTFF